MANDTTSSTETNVIRDDIGLLRRWITVAGVALIALIVASDSYEAWRDYRTTIVSNEHNQLGLSRSLAEQTERMVQEVDLVLGSYAAWKTSAEGRAASKEIMQAHLRDEVKHLPFVYAAFVTNAQGQVQATTQDDPIVTQNFQTRPAFTVPAHALDNTLYIGQPFIGSRDGHVTFVLSHRISDSSNTFDGVVVARVSLAYLASFYAGVNLTPDTSIRLAKTDGVVLAQYPKDYEAISDNMYVQQTYKKFQSNEQIVREHHASEPDKIVALHKVADYPIVVEVTRPFAGVLRPWLKDELSSAIRTLTLAILAGALLLALRAALNRHDRLERERHRLEHELETSQRAQALGLLAASVAHDFNNVLSAIVGYGELAHSSTLSDSPARVHIDRLLNATERARRLVKRVLTFNPHRSVNHQPLRLQPIIGEVLEQLQPILPTATTIQTSGMELEAMILGESTEVYQVIMNLCSNAIHAMPAGGLLQLHLQTKGIMQIQQLAVGQLLPGRWVNLSITDHGTGLAAEQLASIFEPFYTTRESGQGTGIGLTVVRNIVLDMKGALDVQSQLQSGTRIDVYWPLVTTDVIATTTSLETQLETHGNGETILIVDDDAELVMLAEELLASLGYEPVGFTNALAALEAFRRDPARFDAVITDERMQPLRGCDLAQRIHSIEPTIPIILLTGHHDADIDRRARHAGIFAILDKPLRSETLRAVLAGQPLLNRGVSALQ